MSRFGFPEAREHRGGPAAVSAAPRYDVIESATPLTCANTDAQVIRFSGKPDAIDLAAHTFPVIFTFLNEMDVELGEVTVGPGVPYSSHISALVVQARNAIAGSNGIASVVGKWARGRPASPDANMKEPWVAP
jgi:hypothetical protein